MRFALVQHRRERIQTGRGHLQVVAQNVRVALIPPPPPSNPYLSLLYSNLAPLGVGVVEEAELRIRWLWANRRRVDVLHFNWPEGLYHYRRGPARLAVQLSWLKLGAFALRITAARALGYRLVWTIHQVYPHETTSRALDRAGSTTLARACQLLFAHDKPTAEKAGHELGLAAQRVAVVAHGSYVGVYPSGRSRDSVRAELGISEDAFVFLCFGELRGYKDVDVLLESFVQARIENTALVIAGHPKDSEIALRVAAAAEGDPRIKPVLRYVRTAQVAELYGAADAAVVARGDGGTSGSLVLALSMGLPVVVADQPAYRQLVEDGAAGWFFRPNDRDSLSVALGRAAADPDEARNRGRAAHSIALGLGWADIAAEMAPLFCALAR